MMLALTIIGVSCFTLLVLIYLNAARKLPFGPLSLPSVMALTSIIYFYLMPIVALESGQDEFYGLVLSTLVPIHTAAILYAIGAAFAFRQFSASLRVDPSAFRGDERRINSVVFWSLVALAVIGVFAQVALGKFNLFHQDDYVIKDSVSGLAFLNLSYSLMIPLVLVFLIRKNFSASSLFMLLIVLLVFLTIGFRFRIVILLCGAVSSFILIRKIKLGGFRAALGVASMLILVNFIGSIRNYSRGINFANIEGHALSDYIFMFGGEIGPVFTLSHIASTPPDELIFFDPWIVAFTRLIPTFIWPEKPFPEYLLLYSAGFPDPMAILSGVAAPQHVELLLQFGWLGLPFLAFLYFWVAGHTVYRLRRLSREARIAGCAIVPTLFGFYMQQRGYFFQFLLEYIFTILPLFLLHFRARRK